MRNRISERASTETLYDSIKWVVFGIFAIIYFGIKDRYPLTAIGFIAVFILILFIINKNREKALNKIDKKP